MQRNSPLFITVSAEWRYTLWTWRIIKWRNCRRRLRGSCCSCLVRGWSPRNGGSFRAKRTWRRSKIAFISEESSDVPQRVGRRGTRVAILDEVRFWPLQMPPTLSIVGACWREVERVESVGDYFISMLIGRGGFGSLMNGDRAAGWQLECWSVELVETCNWRSFKSWCTDD